MDYKWKQTLYIHYHISELEQSEGCRRVGHQEDSYSALVQHTEPWLDEVDIALRNMKGQPQVTRHTSWAYAIAKIKIQAVSDTIFQTECLQCKWLCHWGCLIETISRTVDATVSCSFDHISVFSDNESGFIGSVFRGAVSGTVRRTSDTISSSRDNGLAQWASARLSDRLNMYTSGDSASRLCVVTRYCRAFGIWETASGCERVWRVTSRTRASELQNLKTQASTCDSVYSYN